MKDDPEQRLPDWIDKAIIWRSCRAGRNTLVALAVCFREATTEEFAGMRVRLFTQRRWRRRRIVDFTCNRRHGTPPHP